MDEAKPKLLIAYALGYMTAYGITTDADAVAKQIATNSKQAGISITEDEIEEVIKVLTEMKALIKSSTILPYA